MRELIWGATAIAATLNVSAVRVPTVSSVDYLGTYAASSRVAVWRGQSADLVVNGQLVDLSTGVEVKTGTGQPAPGMTASVTSVVHGTGSRITIHFTSSPGVTPGNYEILIHYLAETNGPDKVLLRMYDKGSVTALHIAEPTEDGTRYGVGKTYTLNATGSGLAGAAFRPKSGITVLSTLSRSSNEAHYQIKFTTAATTSIGPWDFFDDAMLPDHPTGAQRFVAGYGPSDGGSDLLGLIVAVIPTVTAVSSTNPNVGATLTVMGTDLTPNGYTATVHFPARYFVANGLPEVTATATKSGGALSFVAPPNVRGDSGRIEYARDGSSPADSLIRGHTHLPALSINQPPAILSLSSVRSRPALMQGSRVILGNFLAGGAAIGCSTKSCAVGQPLPTVRLGTTPLTVTSAVYSSTAFEANANNQLQRGIDSVKVSVPAIVAPSGVLDTMTATLTVTTPDGSTTVPGVFYAPNPQITAVQTAASPHTVATNSLVRGIRYDIVGRALRLAADGTVFTGQVQLAGATLPVTATADGSLEFTVPTTASGGALVVTTLAGSTTVGNFSIVDGVAGVSIVGVQLSPATLTGGNNVTATIAVNAVIPSGGSAGNLILSTIPAGDTSMAMPTTPIAVTSNPIVLQLPTRAVASQHSAQIIVSNEATSAVHSSQSAPVTLQPPSITSLTLATPTITGGRGTTITVAFNTTIADGRTIPITLASSDPSAATVPASINAHSSSVTIAVATQVVATSRPVTITATMSGQTQSAVLTVNAPQPNTLALLRSTSVAEVPDSATIALTAIPIGPVTATVECSDAALSCPSTVTITGQTLTFPVNSVAIASPRTATISVTANGLTKTATLNLVPLAIQSVTISPASVTAGAPASVTIQLNAAVPFAGSLAVQLSGNNAAVVTIPVSQATQQFSFGTATKLVPITTRGPVTASTTVTLTASFTRPTTFGTNTSSVSAPLTVTP